MHNFLEWRSMNNPLENRLLQPQPAALGFDANAPLTWQEWYREFRLKMKYPTIFFVVLPTVISVLLSLVGSGKIKLKIVSDERQRTCAAICYFSSVLFVLSGCYFFIKFMPTRAEINERKYRAEQESFNSIGRLFRQKNPDSLEARQINPLVVSSNRENTDSCAISISESDLYRHAQILEGSFDVSDQESRIQAWLKEVARPAENELAP